MENRRTATGPLLGRGMTAEIFAWDPGTVLKLFLPGWGSGVRDYEARVARAAAASGGRVPRVEGTPDVGGRPGIVYERIAGRTLGEVLLEDAAILEPGGRRMAEAHRALHRPAVPGLPGWKDRFRGQIGRCAPLLGSRTPGLLGSLEGLADGGQVCHGDFHPGNILVDGEDWVALDWMNAYAGDPASDVVRAWLMLESPYLDPGIPGDRREAVLAAKRRLAKVYVDAYLGLSGLTRSELGPWVPVVAAVRLGDGVPGEREWLLSLVDGRLGPAVL